MFFFVLFFFLTILVCYTLSYKASQLEYRNRKNARQYAILSLSVLFLFLATRYDIGRDFQNYLYDYYTFDESDYGFGRRFSFEYMNYFVLSICYFFNTGPEGYFAITSFIIVLLFYLIFRDKLFLLPYAFLIYYLCGSYTFAINGIRQAMAMICVIYALTPKIGKDKPSIFHYALWMGIAFVCHNSAMLFIPLYLLYIPKISNIFNGKILILIPLIGFLGNQLGFSNYIPIHWFTDTENIYAKTATNVFFTSAASQLSIAVLINFFTCLVPLYYVEKIETVYPNSNIYFIVYSFGIGLYYFFGSNMLLIRLSYYLMYFNILVYPYFYLYFIKSKKNSLIPLIFNIWYIIYFVGKLGEFSINQIGKNPSVYGLNF